MKSIKFFLQSFLKNNTILKIKQDIDVLAIQKTTKNPWKFHEFWTINPLVLVQLVTNDIQMIPLHAYMHIIYPDYAWTLFELDFILNIVFYSPQTKEKRRLSGIFGFCLFPAPAVLGWSHKIRMSWTPKKGAWHPLVFGHYLAEY